MLTYKPGDSWQVQWTVLAANGAATNADSTPTVKVYRNGADDTANWSLSAVSNPATGRYAVTGTVYASASPGDLIEVEVQATVGGIAAKAFVERFRLVQWSVTSLPAAAVGAAGCVLTAGTGAYQVNTSATGGVVDANVVTNSGHAQQLDANFLPKVDFEDYRGAQAPNAYTAGVPVVDTAYSRGVSVQLLSSVMVSAAATATLVSPVAVSGNATLVIGDSYYAADGRSLRWTDNNLWPDLTGASVRFVLLAPSGTLLLSKAGTIPTPSGANKTIQLELDATDTTPLPAGAHHLYALATLANGHPATLVQVKCVAGEP